MFEQNLRIEEEETSLLCVPQALCHVYAFSVGNHEQKNRDTMGRLTLDNPNCMVLQLCALLPDPCPPPHTYDTHSC